MSQPKYFSVFLPDVHNPFRESTTSPSRAARYTSDEAPTFEHRHQTDMNFQVDTDLEVSSEENSFRTNTGNPTLVIPAGVLSPGRQYMFSMSATNSLFGIGYSGEPR